MARMDRMDWKGDLPALIDSSSAIRGNLYTSMWVEGVKMNMNVLNNSASLGSFSAIRGDLFSSVRVEEIRMNVVADSLTAFSGSSSSDQGNLYSSVGAEGVKMNMNVLHQQFSVSWLLQFDSGRFVLLG